MNKPYFVRHSPCPQCNSKDNLGIYSDGSSYCFGCGFFSKSKRSPYTQEDNSDSLIRPSVPWLVGDAIPRFSSDVGRWLENYPECPIEELIKRGVTNVEGNPSSLLFQWFASQGVPCLQQVRYFPSHPKRKYTTYGKPGDVLPIYYAKEIHPHDRRGASRGEDYVRTDAPKPETPRIESPRKLVIVEDALSAIKMAHSVDAMPCLGSDIPLPKITALSRLYEVVVVWLDGNMYHKARKMAERFSLLGLSARALYTEDDPKCYTNEDMRKFVEGA